ncbi:DUF2087 domain-containing protein [Wenxinia marina]|uniref:Uncharacterized protein n=1 Tax=Wenxinia marina DSM 24838 TaxID=1123501 RepID=A0A0D0Q305_9RHOB|nr:DUF2087 domain-containing protein [Wenxinia marina]KIQ68934.1 Uncharacterized protein Wenmar_02666 [Wenxinia marina DSM 24838]GGL63976.1 hypothetical protein GCM10011392_18360 [Wenxinia marina]
MTRDAISLTIPDLSAFARTLGASLAEDSEPPGHQRLLGHLARAAGYRNWQHLRAAVTPAPAPEPVDRRRVDRALRCFDAEGRMIRWPRQTQVQALCVWSAWARLPSGRDLTEREVNARLKDFAAFGDHVLLRRSLIDHRLAERATDGSVYRRVERRPPAEALEVIRAVQRPSN